MRVDALGSKLEIDLELGRHSSARAELVALTSEYPLRERFRELAMLACTAPVGKPMRLRCDPEAVRRIVRCAASRS